MLALFSCFKHTSLTNSNPRSNVISDWNCGGAKSTAYSRDNFRSLINITWLYHRQWFLDSRTKSNNHKSWIMKPITSNSSMISPDPLSHEQFQKPQSVDDDSMVLLPIYTYICRTIISMFENPLEATVLRIFQQVLTLLIHTWWCHEHSWVITCYHHDVSLFYCYIMANITLLVDGLEHF